MDLLFKIRYWAKYYQYVKVKFDFWYDFKSSPQRVDNFGFHRLFHHFVFNKLQNTLFMSINIFNVNIFFEEYILFSNTSYTCLVWICLCEKYVNNIGKLFFFHYYSHTVLPEYPWGIVLGTIQICFEKKNSIFSPEH